MSSYLLIFNFMHENIDFRRVHQFLRGIKTPCSIGKLVGDTRKLADNVVLNESDIKSLGQFLKGI